MNLKALALAFIVAGVGVSGILFYQWMTTPPTYSWGDWEELKIFGHTWGTRSITLTVENGGNSDLSVTSVQVENASTHFIIYERFFSPAYTLKPGAQGTITITQNFTSGVKYEFALFTAKGSEFTYIATAP